MRLKILWWVDYPTLSGWAKRNLRSLERGGMVLVCRRFDDGSRGWSEVVDACGRETRNVGNL